MHYEVGSTFFSSEEEKNIPYITFNDRTNAVDGEIRITSGVLLALYPYTAERRDVLGCTSPATERFPEALEKT